MDVVEEVISKLEQELDRALLVVEETGKNDDLVLLHEQEVFAEMIKKLQLVKKTLLSEDTGSIHNREHELIELLAQKDCELENLRRENKEIEHRLHKVKLELERKTLAVTSPDANREIDLETLLSQKEELQQRCIKLEIELDKERALFHELEKRSQTAISINSTSKAEKSCPQIQVSQEEVEEKRDLEQVGNQQVERIFELEKKLKHEQELRKSVAEQLTLLRSNEDKLTKQLDVIMTRFQQHTQNTQGDSQLKQELAETKAKLATYVTAANRKSNCKLMLTKRLEELTIENRRLRSGNQDLKSKLTRLQGENEVLLKKS